jgi:exodeoxyribonuclease-3
MKRWLKTGKCSFLPEEREWMARLKNWGLVDSFRHLNPDVTDMFSWFDYRSRGFEDEPKRGLRIDVIIAHGLLPRVKDAAWTTNCAAWKNPIMRRSGLS